MRLLSVLFLLVLSVAAESCDEETQYRNNSKCCKMCKPGERMLQSSTCEDPICQPCEDGEYQDRYTKDKSCKHQPSCDPNLNLMALSRTKTEHSPCVCITDHHCTSQQCDSCVKNRECQPGQKISKNASQSSDTECEPCPPGTFSDSTSAVTCKPWTRCPLTYGEDSPGTSTSDRTCALLRYIIILPLVLISLIMVMVVLCFCYYKKVKTGSASFIQKFQNCPNILGLEQRAYQPAPVVFIDIERPVQPVNQPQEDTEDLVKDAPLSPGLSENGMPVSQDHSKSLILSETETGTESCSVCSG